MIHDREQIERRRLRQGQQADLEFGHADALGTNFGFLDLGGDGDRLGVVTRDGEIIFPDGSAVNWRELWNAQQAPDRATVLAKTMESVRLLDVASLAYVAGHA